MLRLLCFTVSLASDTPSDITSPSQLSRRFDSPLTTFDRIYRPIYAYHIRLLVDMVAYGCCERKAS
jgi:hypothetical protein